MQQHATNPQSPSALIARHLADHTFDPKCTGAQAAGAPAGEETLGTGGSGMHPAVAKHLQGEVGMGGSGMHPAVARHLHGQASA